MGEIIHLEWYDARSTQTSIYENKHSLPTDLMRLESLIVELRNLERKPGFEFIEKILPLLISARTVLKLIDASTPRGPSEFALASAYIRLSSNLLKFGNRFVRAPPPKT